MRVLEAIHDFLPDHRAGSEIYTFHLSRALAARGHDVTLLFTEKRLDRTQFTRSRGSYEGLPFHEIVYNRHFHDIADLYDDPRMEAPIGEVLDEARPDVLHVQSLVYLGLSLIRAAAQRSIPIAMTLHEYFLACPRGGLLLDQQNRLCDPIPFRECANCLSPYPIERQRYPDPGRTDGCQPQDPLRFFERAARERSRRMREGVAPVARFIAPSRFLADRLIREGLDPAKVVVSDYGFPPLPRAPRQPRGKGGPLRIGYLGTISDYKGVAVLVDAFSRLPAGAATCAIHGELSWFPDYAQAQVEKAKGVPGLSLPGPLPPDGVPRFFAAIDVLVVPSLWYENSPLTIHEAWQSGVPVVATDLGGMAELVSRGGGIGFRRGDAADLARVLASLAESPDRLAALTASIPAVKSIEDDATEMEALFHSVAAASRR